jgi:ADP-ribosyl-[dinitrogen reductase] hydrolase
MLESACSTSTLTAETCGPKRIDLSEKSRPSDFKNNGWVVEALQGAWSAITTTPGPEDDLAGGVFRVNHLRLALDAAA